ncbi:ABC transporter substrate-binding protein [Camelliibacillus cellulosilyticus]|uniref:ABC transporter substrate-binding protein n=1 Tax=Camelliibacillus cellulosilyticus TaxID=2174486 RepID=A0ABV9GPN0_9BACL
MKVLKRLLVFSMLLLLVFGISACQSSGSKKTAAGSKGKKANYTTIYENHPITAGAPKNPFNENGNAFLSFDVMQLAWSANSPTDLNKFYPGLAEKWQISDDGAKVTVELQPNAKWSDGTPVTADDVKTSMAISFTQGNAQAFFLGSVKVLSTKKIEFDQVPGQKYNLFFHNLMQQTIVPKSVYGKLLPENIWDTIDQSQYNGDDSSKKDLAKKAQDSLTALGKKITQFAPDKDISAGPFVLKSLNPGEAYLVKNKYFYAADKVKVESVTFRNYTGNQQIWNYTISGQLDSTPFTSMPQNILDKILKNKGNKKVIAPSHVAASIAFNESVYPYNMLDVRKALHYVIDRDAVQKVAEPVVGTPSKYTDGMMDVVTEKMLDPSALQQMNTYDNDPKKAADLLTKAGFKKENGKWIMPNGKPWTATIYTVNGFSDWIQAAKVISTQMTSFGIDTKPKIISSYSQYLEDLAKQKYALAFWLDALGPSMYSTFGRIYGTPDGYNVVGGKLVYYSPKDKEKGNWIGLPKEISLPNGEKVNPGELTYQLNELGLDEQKPVVQKLALATNANVPVIELWNYINVKFVNDTRFTDFPVDDQGLMSNMDGVWMAMGYVHPK